MAKVKPEDIVDLLGSEFRRALAQAVKEIMPDARFDEYKLFIAFKREVGRQCRTWESVSNSCVEID